jgi:transposase
MLMSEKSWKRLDTAKRIEAGELTVGEAAKVLGLSLRHTRRVRGRVKAKGKEGLVHGNQGRRSSRRTARATVKKVLALAKGKYRGFNDQHMTECLGEEEGLNLSRSTVRRLLRTAGIVAARRRRAPKHRRRRDRKPQVGMMIVWDGSLHDWLEDRGPRLCLMGAVDDATSELLPGAHFVEAECSAGYLKVLHAIVVEKGIPLSAYGDQHSSLKRNDDHWTLAEELRGEQDQTQVGRALKALEIERIDALSPQAKGRIERLWGTLQDRLVSEMRKAGVRTLDEANAFLKQYIPRHNRRFAVPPQDSTPAWRKVRPGLDLGRVCAFRYEATVLNDNTVRIQGRVIDIPPGPGGRGYAKKRVEVVQRLDGAWRVYWKDAVIAKAAATAVDELRARRRHKHSAATRAFGKAITRIAASLP